MYIKIKLILIFCPAMINLSYNIHCWDYINDMIIVYNTPFFCFVCHVEISQIKATFATLLV
jgi:hypothetical protein